MNKVYSGMPHLNGNILVAIDFETSGTRAGYHDPLQIAVVPLNEDLRPMDEIRAFYTNIRPEHPERAEQAATRVHRLDINDLCLHALPADRVADYLVEWFVSLNLPLSRKLVPLAHNLPFEYSFLRAWLGPDKTEMIFHGLGRDAMVLALAHNDKAFLRGEKVPFNSVTLGSLCKHFNVINPRPHDALNDALAEAEVYRHLLQMDEF